MGREVKLSRLESVLDELSYPITRSDAATEMEDVTVLFADGEENLGALISETNDDSYSSREDLESEIHNVLPVEAVGEPGQSEGEG